MAGSEQNPQRIRKHHSGHPTLANSELGPSSNEITSINTYCYQQQTFTVTRDNPETPVVSKVKTSGFTLVEEYIQAYDLSESAKGIILASWRKSTKDRYTTVFKKWNSFCHRWIINQFQPNVDNIEFLTRLYETGLVIHQFALPVMH